MPDFCPTMFQRIISHFPRSRFAALLAALLVANMCLPSYQYGFVSAAPAIVLCNTMLFALVIASIGALMSERAQRLWMNSWWWLTVVISGIEYFSRTQFGVDYGVDMVTIIATSHGLWGAWLKSVLTSDTLLMAVAWLAVLIALSWAAVWLSHRRLVDKCLLPVTAVLAALGFIWLAYALIVPQGVTPDRINVYHRLLTAYPMSNRWKADIRRLVEVNREELAHGHAEQTFADRPQVIVIVGESQAAGRMSLYGYRRPTTPRLDSLRACSGERFVLFADVVSVYDRTVKALQGAYSIGGYDRFPNTPFFPTVFRTAGYTTLHSTGQTEIGDICDEYDYFSSVAMAQVQFDKYLSVSSRGDFRLTDILNDAPDENCMVLLHMVGCHNDYEDRYPHTPQFEIFHPEEYPDANKYPMQQIGNATYDNAMHYCDYLIADVINRVADNDACVIFFSDHGEALWQNCRYGTHNLALVTGNWEQMLHVPMFVWCSPKYAANHPEIVEALNANAAKPCTTDDISQTIFTLGGLRTHWLDSTKSMASKSFVAPHPRKVLDGFDYDTHALAR